MSVFLPLHFDIWTAGTSPAKIISVDLPDSEDTIEVMEISGSEGEPVFAMEDGLLTAGAKGTGEAILAATALENVDLHTWVYGHIKLRSGLGGADGVQVKAGQVIGTVRGGDLLLSIIDVDSPETAEGIALRHSPLETMDDLDILPLPGDVAAEDIDTAEEAHAFSESISAAARKPKKSSFLRTALTIGGVGLGIWAFVKIAK